MNKISFLEPMIETKLQSYRLAQPITFTQVYIWTKFPLPLSSKLEFDVLSFDPPSTVLFFSSFFAAVALMKVFSYFGERLGLKSLSEEPAHVPTR